MGLEGVGYDEPAVPDQEIAADQVDGKQHQSMKLMQGAEGVTEGWVSSANPLHVQQRRGSSVNYGQVDIGDSATQILAANSNRIWCMIYNDGDTPCAIGDDGSVTYDNAPRLRPYGETPPLPTTTAWFGCAGSGLTCDMRYLEIVE